MRRPDPGAAGKQGALQCGLFGWAREGTLFVAFSANIPRRARRFRSGVDPTPVLSLVGTILLLVACAELLPLLDAAFSIDGSATLDSQPDRTAVQAELLSLITDNNDFAPYDNDPPFASNPDGDPDGLARCNGSCSGVISTEQVVKAVCGSVLGSAAVLLQ